MNCSIIIRFFVKHSKCHAIKHISSNHIVGIIYSYIRPVLPSVEPGYLHKLLPTEVPEQPEHWTEVMEDVNRVIMPGITHWQSPNFHAYYPTQFSFPSVVADIIASGFGTVNFSWVSIIKFYRLGSPYNQFVV